MIGFADLPVRENVDGQLRRVGIEVEFGALSARQAATAIAEELGGAVAEEDAHAFAVEGTALGTLMVEIDMRYAHPQRHQGTRWGRLGRNWAALLGTAAQPFVPREMVTRPIPVDQLYLVDQAVEALRRAGAREVGPIAFGLHFNPEVPRLDAETITGILKAFVLLNDWLRQESQPRRLSHRLGFGGGFPPAYVRRVVAPDYWPDLADLMNDYLAANPTRDRDLDLLPLFLHLDEQRVRARLPEEKIGKRAVLHYRLPTARVGQPDWSIASDWNRWVAVEQLASDRERLERVAAVYLAAAGKPRGWAEVSARLAFET
ncbi:amidoligase family protein [Belnapia moabensis]|uniref:amidoligase family protein n=1 Tax=Belnapia moabensis TaxID=365533 RepID=UPI001B809624|nr:amidoligase family protein [Belnapia moabensis]